ncbi:MAG: hypothetical protein H0T17_07250 [Propionibacteriales bacterium]|nr:hypothetical protein [Propionibacteriales bacterium]
MDLLRHILLFIHLLGFAALFGGSFVQMRDEVKVVNAAMLYGALTQVVSGLLLVGVIEGQDEAVDSAKAAVKLAVALVVAVLCWLNRSKEGIPRGLFAAVTLLTVANVAVAIFWLA